MKTRIIILIALLVLPLLAFSPTGTGQIRSFLDRDDPESQKFEVVFTVKYNSMTLAEAAEAEKTFRHLFGDACEIKVAINEPSIEIVFEYNGSIWESPSIPLHINGRKFIETDSTSTIWAR